MAGSVQLTDKAQKALSDAHECATTYGHPQVIQFSPIIQVTVEAFLTFCRLHQYILHSPSLRGQL